MDNLKFKYDYLTNRLWRIKETEPDWLYEVENNFPANFGGEGFILGENSWITFTVYEKKIKIFAKFTEQGEITYYRQAFPLIPLNKLPLVVPNFAREIKFEFTKKDQVEKINGQWRKRLE